MTLDELEDNRMIGRTRATTTATLLEDGIWISPASRHRAAVKALGARWIPSRGRFKLPASKLAVRMLREAVPDLDADAGLVKMERDPVGFVADKLVYADPDEPILDLYPYQLGALEWLTGNPHKGALLELSPGLGKTAVALCAALAKDAGRVLVICQKAMVPTWIREAGRWVPGVPLHDWYTPSKDGWERPGWGVTSYEVAATPGLFDRAWDVIVVDESVLIKNRKTRRFATVLGLAKKARRIWLLSGAPITRFEDDLWSQLHLCEPGLFASYWRFAERYTVIEETAWGKKVAGSNDARNVRLENPDLIFARHQQDVLPDLPEIIHQAIDVALTPKQRKVYEDIERDFVAQIEGAQRVDAPNVLAQITRLQQATGTLANFGPEWPDESGKLDALDALWESGAVEYPVIVWGRFKAGLYAAAIRRAIRRDIPEPEGATAVVTGETSDDERDRILRGFQDGAIDVLFLSMGVGKYGHTLTQAKTAIYLEKSFEAESYIQSLHRVQRIGLDHKPLVITLRAPGTVDELIDANLAGKLPSLAKVTGADLVTMLRGVLPANEAEWAATTKEGGD